MSSRIRHLIIVSKSPWDPAVRREHALARLAAGSGYGVTFIEAPADIRTLRGSPGRWLAGIGAGSSEQTPEGIRVLHRSCLVPAHRHRAIESIERFQLHRILRREIGPEPTAVVVTLPWHLGALPDRAGDRRVLDVADDWVALMPDRADRIRSLYRTRVADIDQIILVSEHLASLFDDSRRLAVVRNGVDSDLLDAHRVAEPVAGRMVYVGTLSERFDADVVSGLLDELPAYTVELYGACSYAGNGSGPGPDLARLLGRSDGRATWHGPISRDGLAAVLDGAELLLVPNRGERSRGQDSMKIYDYASRGRPVLATTSAAEGIAELPPHTYAGSWPADLAALALRAREEPVEFGGIRRRWAATHTWQARWEDWESLIFGL